MPALGAVRTGRLSGSQHSNSHVAQAQHTIGLGQELRPHMANVAQQRQRRGDDDLQLGSQREEMFGQVDAVHVAGHVDVGEQQVDARVQQRDEDRGRRMLRFQSLKPSVGEGVERVLPDQALVLDDEYDAVRLIFHAGLSRR